jgi:hypothetical protein
MAQSPPSETRFLLLLCVGVLLLVLGAVQTGNGSSRCCHGEDVHNRGKHIASTTAIVVRGLR